MTRLLIYTAWIVFVAAWIYWDWRAANGRIDRITEPLRSALPRLKHAADELESEYQHGDQGAA